MWCSAGAPGSASDAGVFNGSRLKAGLEEGRLLFPDPDPLPGDDAFALRKFMMKPFSARGLSHQERIFNYRLSRARRVVKNAFGILAHRWHCLLSYLYQEPGNAINIVEASVTLHNLIRSCRPRLQLNEVDNEDDLGNLVPGAWRGNVQLTDTDAAGAGRPNFEGKIVRNYLMDYYSSDTGHLPWQDYIVNM